MRMNRQFHSPAAWLLAQGTPIADDENAGESQSQSFCLGAEKSLMPRRNLSTLRSNLRLFSSPEEGDSILSQKSVNLCQAT